MGLFRWKLLQKVMELKVAETEVAVGLKDHKLAWPFSYNFIFNHIGYYILLPFGLNVQGVTH